MSKSWLVYTTRKASGVTPDTLPDFLPEWSSLTTGNMTWEGWFRILEVPSANTTLLGTYGANHDSLYYALGESRRRFGAVTLDTKGALSFRTNTGRSTGEVQATGPNACDGQWHNVAVVFMRNGGVQVGIKAKITNVDIFVVQQRESLEIALKETIRQVVAEQAKVAMDAVFVEISDDSERRFGFWTRLWANFTVNSPGPSGLQDMLFRLTDHATITLNMRAAVLALEEIHLTLPPFTDKGEILVINVSAPVMSPTGSVQLYVDGYPGVGSITYDPGTDNVGQDNQVIFGGGRLGTPLSCEVSRVRFWSRALMASELEQIWHCEMPSVSALFGGPFPHSLQARYDLNGNLSNTAGTAFASLKDSQSQGEFSRGGACNKERCPEASPEGCPLIRSRVIFFSSPEKCNAFAAFNFCRKAGSSRGRAPQPHFNGCHAGAG